MNSLPENDIRLTVNGETIEVNPGSATLLDFLREDLDLTGAKKACDNGECGSCIVLMGGKPTKACLLPARRAAGKDVVTIEGLAPAAHDLQPEDDLSVLHPLQQAFLVKGATQCGFCIPGMILKAHTLLRSNGPGRSGRPSTRRWRSTGSRSSPCPRRKRSSSSI